MESVSEPDDKDVRSFKVARTHQRSAIRAAQSGARDGGEAGSLYESSRGGEREKKVF